MLFVYIEQIANEVNEVLYTVVLYYRFHSHGWLLEIGNSILYW